MILLARVSVSQKHTLGVNYHFFTPINFCLSIFPWTQKREAEFSQYLQDKLASAKVDFRQLLKETHLITYK